MSDAISTAGSSARRAANSDAMDKFARLGLAANAAIYLLVGVLAVLLAFGSSGKETDQRGALQAIAGNPGGMAILLVIAVGLVGYALWRFSEAAFGAAGEGDKVGPRIRSAAVGVSYTLLAISAFTIAFEGHDQSQAKQQQTMTAKFMHHAGGRWLVGIVGVAIVVVGGVLIWSAVTKRFEKYFRLGRMSHRARQATEFFGVVGGSARGIVFGVVGILVVVAAVQYDPQKARGIDGALRAMRGTAFGPWLLLIVALGLVMYGLFCVCEVRWRKTTER